MDSRRRLLPTLLALVALAVTAPAVHAAGNFMFDIGTITGEKPQSKIWYHDGSYWAVLDGPDGMAIYEKVGNDWQEGGFVDAVLGGSGAADVLWNGTNLFVLVYTSSPDLYKFTYDSGLRAYSLVSGFPVGVPNPSGSETMTFDQDSTGRLWATAEGGGDINVYHTTTSDHQNWSSSIVLASGVNADDISAVIAFGGDKIGVLWSDQNGGEYGFRIHNDADSPNTWSSTEIVDSGSGVADDHLNLATDSTGRIWCSTKNESNELQVHRRSTSGSWTTQQDATSGTGTRPIVMVNEDDDLLYLIYVNWDVDPRSVYYRTSSLNSLNFGNETEFLSDSSLEMNDPTGTKQVLPQGSLMCIATLNDSEAWWNGFGDPPSGGGGATPPTNLVATLQQNPTEVDLTWDEPGSGAPDQYNVFRQEDGGAWILISGSGGTTSTNYTDSSPPQASLCYRVTAETGGDETSPSNTDCVDNNPPAPPENLVATLQQNPDAVDLSWDEPPSGAPDGYNVYRQVDGGNFLQINGSPVTSTTFTDTSPPESPLCYRVTAETNGNETAESNTDCVDNTPPAPPENLMASLQQFPLTPDPDEVTLTWAEPATGAPDGYNVYREVNGGGFTQINGSLVTDTQYSDIGPPQDPLCYYVTAETNGEETAPSNTDCVDNTPPSPPDAPESLTLTQVDPGSASRVLGLLFDDSSGDLVDDFSGQGNHGWRGRAFGADAADPVSGSVAGRDFLTFDGSDDVVLLPDADSFDFAGSFTLEAWVRPAALDDAVLIEKGPIDSCTFSLRLTSAGEVGFLWTENGAQKSVLSSPLLSNGVWSHVAGVYDASAGENRLYVDGSLVQTSGVSGTPSPNDDDVSIGAAADSTAAFAGDIDEVHAFADAVYDVDFIAPLKAAAKATAPAATHPDRPRITAGGAGVLLEWSAPSGGEPAASYNVYRTVDQSTQLLNPAPLTTTSFLDSDSLLGQRCYEITALSDLGLEGDPTASECVDVGALEALPQAPEQVVPTLVTTPPELTEITWQPPSSGSTPASYHVYRSVNGAFPQRISPQPVPTLAFTDSMLMAGDLCYSVRSVLADGREGTAASDSCLQFVPLPPSEPQFVIVAQDSTPVGPASGIAAYRMDENGGQDLADATGNGHTGYLGDDPAADSSDPTWVAGVSGSALQFDGADDVVTVPDAPDLQIAGSFTVEAWFKLTGSGDHAILSKGGSQERNYWIIIESGGVIDFRWETSGGGNHGTTSSEVVLDSDWHHVACVYDMQAGEDRIYLDGVLVEQASDSGTPTTSSDPFYIGARISSSSLTDEFDGCIDLVRVSAGALYTADFTPPTDYNSGSGPSAIVNLSWAAPATGYTTHYKILRSVDGGAWSVLDNSVTELSFIDTTLDSVGPLVCYQITAIDGAGSESAPSPPVCIGSSDPTSVWDPPDGLATPPRAGLRVGPNPFNPNVRIQFDLARTTHLTLRIYDVRGRLVDTLWEGMATAGEQSFAWNGRTHTGRSVASGSYFVILRAGERTERRKITLVR